MLKITIPDLPAAGSKLPFLREYEVIASDTFSGGASADIDGRATDSALGGSAKTWQSGPANSYAISANGLLTRGSQMSAQCGAALNIGFMDIRTCFVLAELPPGSIYFDHMRAAPDLGAPPTPAYRLRVAGSTVNVLITGIAEPVLANTEPLYLGDSVGLEIVGGYISLLVNGQVIGTYKVTTPLTGGYLEIVQGATSTIALDSLTVESVQAVG